MQVFISWSGDRSRRIAEALREWLPMVIQSVKPWMSDADISAGSRWLTEVSTVLNTATVGIICVTPENQHNPWLLFEAGALSKTIEQTCVCPLVYEMTTGQLSGPLTQFQANVFTREGIAKILGTINKSLGERQLEIRQLEEIIDVWWPKLEAQLEVLGPAPEVPAVRSTGDQLEELLSLSREQLRRENLRLEAYKERENRFESFLSIMDKAGSALSVQQAAAKSIQGTLPLLIQEMMKKTGNVLGEAEALELNEAGAALISSMNLDPKEFASMATSMRELHELDKQNTKRMLDSGVENPSDQS